MRGTVIGAFCALLMIAVAAAQPANPNVNPNAPTPSTGPAVPPPAAQAPAPAPAGQPALVAQPIAADQVDQRAVHEEQFVRWMMANGKVYKAEEMLHRFSTHCAPSVCAPRISSHAAR
jgi:hypothetical protein